MINHPTPLTIRAVNAPWYGGVQLLAETRIQSVDGPIHRHVGSLTFAPWPDSMIPDPTAHLTYEAAQQLMDELWQSGLRPTQGHGSAGKLEAVENHLHDMRTLAFKGLGVELPE